MEESYSESEDEENSTDNIKENKIISIKSNNKKGKNLHTICSKLKNITFEKENSLIKAINKFGIPKKLYLIGWKKKIPHSTKFNATKNGQKKGGANLFPKIIFIYQFIKKAL